MNCLLVYAHPLENSLCRYIVTQTVGHLKEAGHSLVLKDLYKESFDPVLSRTERESYYSPAFDTTSIAGDIRQLREADCLVLVFPTWWFGLPALLKGWVDRVWAPGHAYHHTKDMKAITPNLDRLKSVRVITTLGSPWWVDWLIMRRPVRKALKYGLIGTCTRSCDFKMLSLYSAEALTDQKVGAFIKRIKKLF